MAEWYEMTDTIHKLPLISIVVPFRNAREDIGECAVSLLNQDYPKDGYEIIMVDDGSDDDGAAVLKQYGDIRLLKGDRCGSYAARNKGILAARGGIIAFTDSDCIADKGWLNNIAHAFGASAAAVAGEIMAHRPSTDTEIYWEGCMKQKKNLSDAHPYAVTANVAFRKSILEELGAFDPAFLSCGDVDLCWRLLAKGYRIEYAPGAVVYHKNIKTRAQVFRKIFFQSSYVPKAVRKNLRFLERSSKLRRVAVRSYGELLRYIYSYIFAHKDGGSRREPPFNIVSLAARKLGLIYGSIRHGFLYI